MGGGRVVPVPQPAEGITYARKITKEDGRVDWMLPALVIDQRTRAFTPWPGTFSKVQGADESSRILKIHRLARVAGASGPPGRVVSIDRDGIVVACGHDAVRLLEVQPEGGRRMTAAAYAAGHPVATFA